jgi:molybdenum cofactor synthesis domain-containing protein
MPAARPSAAILVIGDEVLRGETQDCNSHFLALRLTAAGVAVDRISTVPDELDTVAREVAALSATHDHVFTSGGIGPTPDDITRLAVARALRLPLELHKDALQLMRQRVGGEPSAGQMEMCRWPAGAQVLWTQSGVPSGCLVRNLLVMPGVPQILEAIFDQTAHLFRGEPEHTVCFEVHARESDFAALLATFVEAHPELKFGSYPTRLETGWRVELRVRGDNAEQVVTVAAELRHAVAALSP